MENKSGITPTLAISCEDFEKIKNSIEEKDKEIERLKEVEKEHQKLNEELREEIERLNNIINEKDCIIPYIYHKKTKTWLPLKRSDIIGSDNNE